MKKMTYVVLILVVVAQAACSQPRTEPTPAAASVPTQTSPPSRIPTSTPGPTATAQPNDTMIMAPAATATSAPTAVSTLIEAPVPTRTRVLEVRPASRVPYYDMGSPVLQELWVDPISGDDGRSGTSRAQALRTIGAAWALIPPTLPVTGYQINLLPGDYPCEGDCINFFSDRAGSFDCPIILRAAEGPSTVVLRGGLNLLRVRYLYLIDLTLWAGREAGAAFGNNVLHIEQADHVLMRTLTLRGPIGCITDDCNEMQEVLKVNQSQYVYLEDSDLSGAYQTVLDYFAVQHGPITPPGQARNVSSPSQTDTNLVIKGNIIWNSLQEDAGIVGDNNGSGNVGCQANHPTCSDSLLLAQNHINEFRPELVNPAGGDFRPLAAGNVFAATVFPVPDFQWADAPTVPPVPTGTLSNVVLFDRDGKDRRADGPPGAYGSATPRTLP